MTKPYLHSLKLPELLVEWDRLDNNGTNIAAVRALCLIDRYYLLVKVMKRVDMLNQWILDRCREVEASPDGHLDLWAREHYKSTIITFAGSIQEILNNPNITIGIFSHTKDIARDFLSQIKRELENNELLRKAFPDILYDKPSEAQAGTWNLERLTVKRNTNPKEATVEAHGLVEGMPTGKHFELMVYDDVVVPASVTTPEQIAKTTQAWELSDNLGARSASGFTRKWHIGTRYSYADTYDVMLKRGVVTPRIYPATEDGMMDGVPVLLTQAQWDLKVKTQGQATVSCQMLQDPLSGTNRTFDRSDIQVYEIRPHTLNVYITVDPARSMKKGSDNTAITVVGVDSGMNKYLLDGINHRCSLLDRYDWVKMLYNKWKSMPGVQACFVGYEKYGALADLDYFKAQMKIDGSFIIKELAAPAGMGNASKIDRVQRLDPDLRRHKLFLPYPTHPNKLTSNQMRLLNMKPEELTSMNMTVSEYMNGTSAKHIAYRLSKIIKRKDSDGVIYDLSAQLVEQIHYFPHGGKVDLIDALSRIYDMDMTPPFDQDYSKWTLEPDLI